MKSLIVAVWLPVKNKANLRDRLPANLRPAYSLETPIWVKFGDESPVTLKFDGWTPKQ